MKTIYKRYKDAKRSFRKEQRRSALEYETENMKEMNRSSDIYSKYFWYLVNRRRKHLNKVLPVKSIDGSLVTNVDDIRQEWTQYYCDLFEEHNIAGYDDNFKQFIENKVAEISQEPRLSDHLNGGPVLPDTLHSVLAFIMNLIITLETIPDNYKKELIVSIPKPQKDTTIKENNRGITLIPVI